MCELKDLKIRKRDGRLVDFDRAKIINASMKAFISQDGKVTAYAIDKSDNIADYVEEKAKANPSKILEVEDIQDMVENGLSNTKRKDVAFAYHDFRNKRSNERQKRTALNKSIQDKLAARNVKNQNANVDEYSFGGRKGEAGSELFKWDALNNVMSKMARENHVRNIIYTHDLDSFSVGMHNCLSIPFDDLLKDGFNTRQTDVRPAQSVNTAFQLVAVIFQLQSLNQFGGCSATHLDWTMIPYVRKSFMKHYITALLKDSEDFMNLNLIDLLFDEYEENIDNNYTILRNKFDDWIDKNKVKVLKENNLTEDDFYFDNNKLDPKYKQIALFETIKETQQAAEGMYHNLNTLQSRSGKKN